MQEIDYTKHYRTWHSDTPEHIAETQRFYRRLLLESLPAAKDAAILDVGCGMGFAMLALRNLGFTNVQGLEVDAGQARSCLAKGLDVAGVKDTAIHLSANQNEFDVILALDVIEHIALPAQFGFVAAILGALKPGGRLVCTVPNANSTLAGRWRYVDWTHQTSFTESSLSFLLESVGFARVRVSEAEIFIKHDYPKAAYKAALNRGLLAAARLFRRFEMMAELGVDEGRRIPISVNLLGLAFKPPTPIPIS